MQSKQRNNHSPFFAPRDRPSPSKHQPHHPAAASFSRPINETSQSVDLQKAISFRKPRPRSALRPFNFPCFNAAATRPLNNNANNISSRMTTEPEPSDRQIIGNHFMYSGHDASSSERESESLQKMQAKRSLKLHAYVHNKKNLSQNLPSSISKNPSASNQPLVQELSAGTQQSNKFFSSPRAYSLISKQITGHLNRLWADQSPPGNLEGRLSLKPQQGKSGQETRKPPTTFYESLRNFVESKMEAQNSLNLISCVQITEGNSPKERSNSRSGVSTISLQHKNSTKMKIIRPGDALPSKESFKTTNENEDSHNQRMRQALIKHLFEINPSVKKVVQHRHEHSESQKIGSQQSLNDSHRGKISIVFPKDYHREDKKMRFFDKRPVIHKNTSEDTSILLSFPRNQDKGGDHDNTQITSLKQTDNQESPKEVSRKKIMFKKILNGQATNKRYASPISKISTRADLSKHENDNSHQKKDKTESRKGLGVRESREKVGRPEDKSIAWSSMAIGQSESALEKELVMQQGRNDMIEGWDFGMGKTTSPGAFKKIAAKNIPHKLK